MVYVDGETGSTHKHFTPIEAKQEAERLARIKKGSKVHVLQAVKSCIISDVAWEERKYKESDLPF